MNKPYIPQFYCKRVNPADKLAVIRLQRLRYKVYKEEFNYPEVPENEARLDRDEFEPHVAQHFAMYEGPTSKPVGCLRLIRGPNPFMAQLAYDGVFNVEDLICDRTSSESSRFTFAKAYRGRGIKTTKTQNPFDFSYALSLVKQVRSYCRENGIRWNYAVTSWLPYVRFLQKKGAPLEIILETTLKNGDSAALVRFDFK